MCFAFLLTQNSHAESEYYNKAQKFFYDSNKAVSNYFKTGKGLESVERIPSQRRDKSQRDYQRNSVKYLDNNYQPLAQSELPNSGTRAQGASQYNIPSQSQQGQNQGSYLRPKAFYLSLISRSVNDQISDNPDYSLSLGISVPVYSTFNFLSSEFQISGDIKNTGDWGQAQLLQKEALHIITFADIQVDVVAGMGLGYAYGDRVGPESRYYAPWLVGVQWGKIYRSSNAFYRFELGWTGNFFFSESNYNQGLLANLSLGYKL